MTADSVPAQRLARRPLRASATIELVSLAVLLVNIAAGNAQEIAALFGPVHGVAWLFGILATWRDPQRSTGAALRAVIPGIGGLLALRALERATQAAPGAVAGAR
ncbi:hypothetical protein RKE30_25875 [Streptomyces sp. Li-HN-5-11]|uniref:hypothetical protein n=1 Tax=Streptomyces sp. Li-HN-5-11 TaxID=3075432 RepID=UPI0028B19BE0|nr:hypothetical protein [Streptomyces sp. Li-HN-5-11]WNM33576.1 hypothetical protein RKE30_25875 [Streptomyces sp. Li-HN-5-11]